MIFLNISVFGHVGRLCCYCVAVLCFSLLSLHVCSSLLLCFIVAFESVIFILFIYYANYCIIFAHCVHANTSECFIKYFTEWKRFMCEFDFREYFGCRVSM